MSTKNALSAVGVAWILGSSGCTQSVADPREDALAEATQPVTLRNAVGHAFVTSNGVADSNYSTDVSIFHTFSQPGIYNVTFKGLGVTTFAQGVVHVTSYGLDRVRCNPLSVAYSPAPDVQVVIGCVGMDGTMKDAPFSITFERGSSTSTQSAGYLSIQQSDQTFGTTVYNSGNADVAAYNASGGDIVLTHDTTGNYTVRFKSLNVGGWGGTTRINSIGYGTCQATGWGPNGSDEMVSVQCMDRFGALADSGFDLSVTNQPSPWYAFALADQPTSAVSYTPNMIYQASSRCLNPQPAITIAPRGTGVYDVTFPGMGTFAGRRSLATASYIGEPGGYCNIGSKGGAVGGAATATVRCYNTWGTPINALFTIMLSLATPDNSCPSQ